MEVAKISGWSRLVPVRCLVMHHHHPWLVLRCLVLQHVESQLCDLVRHMSVVVDDVFAILDKFGLVVFALAFQDVPVIESILTLWQ